jgi:hypothetical protein
MGKEREGARRGKEIGRKSQKKVVNGKMNGGKREVDGKRRGKE